MKPQPSQQMCAACSSALAVLANWKKTPQMKAFLTSDCPPEKELGFGTEFSKVYKEGYEIVPRPVSVGP